MTYPAPTAPFLAAKYHGGPQVPRLIVLHSTVSPCREGQAKATAEFFAKGTHVASAHYSVDPGDVWQSVHDHVVAYHCGYNQDSIGIEMCDYPDAINKSRWDDADHLRMERRTARLVAELCLAYNIPPRYVGKLALLAGLKGVTTHSVMSSTYHKSTHWDPGAWRRFRFMRRVRRQVKRIKAGL